MSSRRLPLWAGWLLALAVAAACASLGAWQLQRMHAKQAQVDAAAQVLADRRADPLSAAADPASARGYRFDRGRIDQPSADGVPGPIPVTDGQLAHEWGHLRAKLAARSPEVASRWADVVVPDPHPSFVVVSGPVASWERVSDGSAAASARPRPRRPAAG